YFEIDGDIVRSECVVEAAHVLSEPVHHLRLHVLRALEHDVLKEMSEPAATVRIVLRSDVIPNLYRHCWTGTIRRAQHTKTVCESAIRELELRHSRLCETAEVESC